MLSAILLAAGTSQRMGANNKLLLPWQGSPIVTVIASRLLTVGLHELIVVTGHEAPQVTTALSSLPLRIVHNPHFAEGITSSIQTGVREATGNGYMICLADMILITSPEYIFLKEAWEKQHTQDAHCIALPEYQGRNGNPVIFPALLRNEILSHPEKEGCRGIVQRHPAHHLRVPMPYDHILRDMDWPEEYVLLHNDN